MYKKYSLGTFFLCIVLLLAGAIGLISYGWRKNAAAQVYEDNGHRYSSWFGQKGVDVYAPFYESIESASLEPRPRNYVKDSDGVDFPEKGTFDSTGYPQRLHPSVMQNDINQKSNTIDNNTSAPHPNTIEGATDKKLNGDKQSK
jgi:hypothetical protein